MPLMPYSAGEKTRAALLPCLALACAALAGAPAAAQQVYRHVGPDGRVVFSDQPPPGAADAAAAPARRAPDSNAALPYALRQTAGRFPVVLYTGADCAPCDSARQWLKARGIPFAERTVQSNEDIAALQALSGQSSLPFATIGAQHLRGFSAGQWGQYADAAGYPATSQLPARYQYPAPQPLTEPAPVAAKPPEKPAATKPAPAPPAPTRAAPPPGTPTRDNPAGIIF